MASTARGNIGAFPLEGTSFVGRRQTLAQAKRLLSASRLVTLTGVAGIGKTRLAVRLAARAHRDFPDGVWLVDLGQVQDAGLVADAVAGTLGLREPAGGRPPTAALVDYLAGRRLLLVLDNCEHLVDAVASLAGELLRATPRLRILATSRERLAIGGESILPVSPLSLPDSGSPLPPAKLARYEAVSLFVERAGAVVPDFRLTEDNCPAVVDVCHRLEGLPLAIELAAARLRDLSPGQISERLADRYHLLVRSGNAGPSRHQTLRSCIAWSYDLCTAAERTLWARFAVFSGGFELDAAEGVCAGGDVAVEDVLDLLLTDRQVHPDLRGARRGDAVPAVGDHPRVRPGAAAGHRRGGRAAPTAPGLVRVAGAARVCGLGEPAAGRLVHRLDREHTNVQAAMDYCLTEPGEAESAMRMLPPLFHFYFWGRGWYREGRQWIDRALALATRPSALRATVLLRDVAFRVSAGDSDTAHARLEEGWALARKLGDPAALALAEYAEGMAAQYRGELAESIASFDRGMAVLPEGENLPLRLDLLLGFAVSGGAAGNVQRAISAHETTLALTETAGESFHRSYALWALGLLAFQQGDIARAADLQRQSLRLRRQLKDDMGSGWCLEFLAWPEGSAGRHRRAATLLGAADQVWEITGLSLRAFQHLVPYHDDCERRARESLGDDAFEAAFRRGRDVGIDEVIQYALDDKPQRPAASTSAGAAAAANSRA